MNMASQNNDIIIYMTSVSPFCQRVLYAFEEKKLKYSRYIVKEFETYEPWYLKINPKGQIPTLKCGSDIISESIDIIKYIDKRFPEVPLIPAEFEKEILDVVPKLDVDIIPLFYGTLKYPNLTKNSIIPDFLRRRMEEKIRTNPGIQVLERHMKENPDMHDIYEAKISAAKEKGNNAVERAKTEEDVIKLRDNVVKVLDEIEEVLNKKEDPSQLFGNTVTLADIMLIQLLNTLFQMGLSEDIFSSHPKLAQYFEKAKCQPAFKKAVNVSLFFDVFVPTATKAISDFFTSLMFWKRSPAEGTSTSSKEANAKPSEVQGDEQSKTTSPESGEGTGSAPTEGVAVNGTA